MAAPNTPESTHKRTSSAVGNPNEAPKIKRQAIEVANTPVSGPSKPSQAKETVQPQLLVYIAIIESHPSDGPDSPRISDVYASKEDANNAVR